MLDRPQSQPLRSSGFGSGSNTVNQTPPRTAGSLGLGVSLGRSAISSSPVHVYDLMHVSENTRYGNAVFVALPGMLVLKVFSTFSCHLFLNLLLIIMKLTSKTVCLIFLNLIVLIMLIRKTVP